jgi:acyl-CoA reductase-like NAD-dependent aldehyde dehydrogenase
LTFDSGEETISKANDTDYGLAAGVMTKDVMRAHRIAKRLEAGSVWVNNSSQRFTVHDTNFGTKTNLGHIDDLLSSMRRGMWK